MHSFLSVGRIVCGESLGQCPENPAAAPRQPSTHASKHHLGGNYSQGTDLALVAGPGATSQGTDSDLDPYNDFPMTPDSSKAQSEDEVDLVRTCETRPTLNSRKSTVWTLLTLVILQGVRTKLDSRARECVQLDRVKGLGFGDENQDRYLGGR